MRPHRSHAIARRYLTSWFLIDFISVLPFDLIDLLLVSGGQCEAEGMPDSSLSAYTYDSSSALADPGMLMALKLIRLLRLLKLARVLRASRILNRWDSSISMSYSA